MPGQKLKPRHSAYPKGIGGEAPAWVAFDRQVKLIRDDLMTRRFRCVEGCVAELLTHRTLDLEIGGSSLACRVVSLDKELYSILSFFTQGPVVRRPISA